MAKAKEKTGPKYKLVITDEILREIEEMGSEGATQQQIHHYYGIGHSTWYKMVKEYPELRTVIRRGKAKTFRLVVGELMKKVRDGNLSAIIFILKTQYGWSEGSSLTLKDKRTVKNTDLTLGGITDPVEASRLYQAFMTGSVNNERNSPGK